MQIPKNQFTRQKIEFLYVIYHLSKSGLSGNVTSSFRPKIRQSKIDLGIEIGNLCANQGWLEVVQKQNWHPSTWTWQLTYSGIEAAIDFEEKYELNYRIYVSGNKLRHWGDEDHEYDILATYYRIDWVTVTYPDQSAAMNNLTAYNEGLVSRNGFTTEMIINRLGVEAFIYERYQEIEKLASNNSMNQMDIANSIGFSAETIKKDIGNMKNFPELFPNSTKKWPKKRK